MIDARATLEHAKDWGCFYNDLARRADVPYWRFLGWMNGKSIMTPDEQGRLERLAEAYVADQKRAVDLVMENPRGIAATLGIQMTTVIGWKRKMHVPLSWMAAVLEKGPSAPTPATVSAEERRTIACRAASARWGDMGPLQSVVLQRITDAPERAYLYALGKDLVVPRQYISGALSRLMRGGHIRVRGWSKNGSVRRKMYGPVQKETPTETASAGAKAGLQGVPQQHDPAGSPML